MFYILGHRKKSICSLPGLKIISVEKQHMMYNIICKLKCRCGACVQKLKLKTTLTVSVGINWVSTGFFRSLVWDTQVFVNMIPMRKDIIKDLRVVPASVHESREGYKMVMAISKEFIGQ